MREDDIELRNPEVVRGEGSLFNGREALSLASSSSWSDASINRHLRTVDTFDFLNEYGYAVCIALLAHAPPTDYETILSNKIATTDLGIGLRLSVIEVGAALFIRANIGNGVSATIASGTADQEMRGGAPDLISFRFSDVGVNWRLESMIGVATGAKDNAPAANTGNNLYLGADAPALTTKNFRGHIA